jgi:hypothetical protein
MLSVVLMGREMQAVAKFFRARREDHQKGGAA